MRSDGGLTSKRPGPALLAEAGLIMILGSAAIRFVAFRVLARLLARRGGSRFARAPDIVPIRRAIRAWSRRLPWRTMCFEEGLTAHCMLRRRGIRSTLYYGAATVDGELKAHVWVQSGDTDVIGCETAEEYALLARFPED